MMTQNEEEKIVIRKTSKIGEAPPETPPGVIYLEAELIDDLGEVLRDLTSTSKDT